jgi:hypothetical protein
LGALLCLFSLSFFFFERCPFCGLRASFSAWRLCPLVPFCKRAIQRTKPPLHNAAASRGRGYTQVRFLLSVDLLALCKTTVLGARLQTMPTQNRSAWFAYLGS